MNYVSQVKPKKVLLVHGDEGAMKWFTKTINDTMPNTEVIAPEPKVAIEL
jgi:predicted metal-dependent RNase